jgi:cell division protein YceG involved in septum cleavage
MKRKTLILTLALAVLCLLLSTNALAVFYTAKIIQATPKADGTVTLQISPGTGETRFVEDPARVDINPSDAGANTMYATALTAISLAAEVRIDLASPPSFTRQDVVAMGLTAP